MTSPDLLSVDSDPAADSSDADPVSYDVPQSPPAGSTVGQRTPVPIPEPAAGSAALPPPQVPSARPHDVADPHDPRRSWRTIVAAIGFAAAAVLGGSGAGYIAGQRAQTDATAAADSAIDVRTVGNSETASDTTNDIAAIVASLSSSVVSVDTVVTFRRGPFEQTSSGAGTGVVIGNGLILTNAHVVESATSVTISVADDASPREATIVASDPTSDIAVLSVENTDGLVIAPTAPTGSVTIGDPVLAIGNALSLEGGMTVTSGIISALNRTIDTDDGTLTELIQTDAAISSGNSGGPLVDAGGRIIGINTAVAASYGSVQVANIGFAIDIDHALEVADDLLAAS